MDYYTLYAVLIVVQTLSVVFHTCGLYLLKCLSKLGRGDLQLLLVGNLSATELLLNITYITLFSCNIIWHKLDSSGFPLWDYIQMFSGSTLKFVYYATMVCLTVNKLLEVVLNISYPNHCTKRRGKLLLAFTWVLGFLFFIMICVADTNFASFSNSRTNKNNTTRVNESLSNSTQRPPLKTHLDKISYNTVFTYFYTGFDFFFIFIAVGTYAYIFHKYRESKSDPVISRYSRSEFQGSKSPGVWKVFRNSRFYISCLLIVTFLLMVVLPKLVYFFYLKRVHRNHGMFEKILAVVVGVLYYFSFLADVFIYVFLHPPLKRLMWKKLRKISCLSDFITTTPTAFNESFRMTLIWQKDEGQHSSL